MDPRRLVALVVLIIGVLALIVGLMYLLIPAESLPGFLPGHLAGVHAKHSSRGAAGLGLGVVLILAGVAIGYRRRSLYPH
jgi:uncharacterized membrane protein HdeD (DUF308 family)